MTIVPRTEAPPGARRCRHGIRCVGGPLWEQAAWITRWKPAPNAFAITFEGRIN